MFGPPEFKPTAFNKYDAYQIYLDILAKKETDISPHIPEQKYRHFDVIKVSLPEPKYRHFPILRATEEKEIKPERFPILKAGHDYLDDWIGAEKYKLVKGDLTALYEQKLNNKNQNEKEHKYYRKFNGNTS